MSADVYRAHQAILEEARRRRGPRVMSRLPAFGRLLCGLVSLICLAITLQLGGFTLMFVVHAHEDFLVALAALVVGCATLMALTLTVLFAYVMRTGNLSVVPIIGALVSRRKALPRFDPGHRTGN